MLERLAHGLYSGVKDLYERVQLDRDTLEALARAGAFDGLQERRDALYQIGALVHVQPPALKPMLSALPDTPPLPELSVKEQVMWDYRLKSSERVGCPSRRPDAAAASRPGRDADGATASSRSRHHRRGRHC